MKRLLLGATASIALVLSAAPARAQESGPRDLVTVWGQLEETLAGELETYGARLDVVTEEQIKDGGFSDAGQALQMLVPGLYVAPKNGAFDYVNVSLLGGRRQDVIWLIDGVRVSNRLYTTTTPLDTIPAHMIERIEVLKGGQSLFYGTSAVSGAINIITRGFSDELKGAVSVGADTNDGKHANGYTSGAFGEHHFVAFASYDQADGFQPFRDADYQPSSTARTRGYDVTTYGGKYGYDFSDALKLSLNYQHTDAKLDYAYAEDVAVAFNDRDEDLISAKIDWAMGDDFDLFVKAYYHSWDTEFTRFDNTIPVSGATTAISDAEFWGFEDYGVNVMGQYAVTNAITLVGGADYQNYSGEDEVFLIGKQTESVFAPFAQVRWDLDVLNGLNLAAGVRHNMPSGDSETTVWNVSGKLGINDYLYTRGMVGTAFRLPDAYELYVVDPCCEQGNANLKGEESYNIELGLGGQGERVSWELTAFRRELDDLIQIITMTEDRPPGQQIGNYGCDDDLVNGCYDTFDNNGAQVEVNGYEFVATVMLTDDLSTTFDWTHSESEADGAGAQLVNIPKDTAKLMFDWSPVSAFGGGVSINYVGDVEATVSGVPGRIDYGDYFLIDLNGRWYLDSDHKHRIGLRVENLLDEDYNSSMVRVREDVTDVSYAAGNLGTERTFHISYTYGF